jgi:hypothetical protein
MKDSDFLRLVEFTNEGTGCLIPFNDRAHDLTDTAKAGEIINLLEVTDRSVSFHRCYFSLLGFIYDQLPNRFHKKLPKKYFYRYLSHLKGNFDIVSQFGGIVLVEYESISFGRMSEYKFRDYIRNLLPWIYSDVIGKYYKVGGWRYKRKVNNIEEEFSTFLTKL